MSPRIPDADTERGQLDMHPEDDTGTTDYWEAIFYAGGFDFGGGGGFDVSTQCQQYKDQCNLNCDYLLGAMSGVWAGTTEVPVVFAACESAALYLWYDCKSRCNAAC